MIILKVYRLEKIFSCMKNYEIIIVALAVFALVTAGIMLSFSGKQKIEQKIVTKVIDGDTIVIEGGGSVRLLGIDADERGHPCYAQAKARLEELVLDKKVFLESDQQDKDRYGRLLRYVFIDNENINLEMVREGLAVARFQEDTKYRKEITAAEQDAIKNKTGCKWSG